MLEKRRLAIYHPSKRRTKAIGIIVPKLDCHFITSALRGIGETASRHGYELIITHSQDKMAKEVENANLLFHQRVDGLIASLSADTDSIAHFSAFREKGIPVLFFDRTESVIPGDTVVIDNARCGYMATEHLINQGCKRIGFVSSCGARDLYGKRYQGFREALHKYSVAFTDDLLILADTDRDSGSEVARIVLKTAPMPDGLFITNDLIAAECMHSLMENGIRVPHDIAIVGFNNDPVSNLIWPALSTIDCSGLSMGKAAAARLFRHLSGRSILGGLGASLVPSTLLVRGSSLKESANCE
jgi:LacI family transcriptional regulator